MGFIKRRYKIILFIMVLFGGMAAFAYYASYNYAYFNIRNDSLGQYIGPDDAEIVMIEVIDYRCPVCRKVEPEVQEFVRQHGNVKVIHKHFPAFGDQSVFEAQIALAAGLLGKYEQAHNFLIRQNAPMSPPAIREFGETLHIDLDELYDLMNSEAVHDAIRASAFSVARYGVNSTPAFIINDEVHEISGPPPTAKDFMALVNRVTKNDAPDTAE